MAEKERYVVLSKRQIKDMQNQSQCFMSIEQVCKRLNHQDKQIKELQGSNKVLSNELTKNNIMKQDRLETCCGIPIYEIPTLKQENRKLKQSQKQLAISELEKLREYIILNDEYDEEIGCNIIETFDLLEDISDRIEKLGSEEK